jgi:RHS repeat-associated protein
VQITAPGLAAGFTYDPIGRRLERRITRAGEPPQITQYLYDGLQAAGELRLAQGSTPAQQTSLVTGLALDEVLARVTRSGSATQQRSYLTDALNSVFAQAREDQSVVNRYRYSAYGETASSGDDEGNAIQYTGRENDGTGLYFYRARYYDAVLKRFVSEDPIGLLGGINTYAYVIGNPLSFTDPLGLYGIEVPDGDPGSGVYNPYVPNPSLSFARNVAPPGTNYICWHKCMQGRMLMCSTLSAGGAGIGAAAGGLVTAYSGGTATSAVQWGATAGWVGGQALCRAALDCEKKCKEDPNKCEPQKCNR